MKDLFSLIENNEAAREYVRQNADHFLNLTDEQLKVTFAGMLVGMGLARGVELGNDELVQSMKGIIEKVLSGAKEH